MQRLSGVCSQKAEMHQLVACATPERPDPCWSGFRFYRWNRAEQKVALRRSSLRAVLV